MEYKEDGINGEKKYNSACMYVVVNSVKIDRIDNLLSSEGLFYKIGVVPVVLQWKKMLTVLAKSLMAVILELVVIFMVGTITIVLSGLIKMDKNTMKMIMVISLPLWSIYGGSDGDSDESLGPILSVVCLIPFS